MYAVIQTGGKQSRVSEGQTIDVELLGEDEGAEVTFQPILLVDGDTVVATPGDLAKACLLYTSPSPRDGLLSRMPSSA